MCLASTYKDNFQNTENKKKNDIWQTISTLRFIFIKFLFYTTCHIDYFFFIYLFSFWIMISFKIEVWE